jgi:hypothetical protein
MSLWSKLKGARKPGSGNYFNPGRYRCLVQRVASGDARDGIPYFAIEVIVVEVLVRQDQTPVKQRNGETKLVDSNQAGAAVAQVIKIKPEIEATALGNYKSFVCAALDLEDSDLDSMTEDEFEKEMESITEGDGTALQGTPVIANAIVTQTKSGHDFVKVTWESADHIEAAS